MTKLIGRKTASLVLPEGGDISEAVKRFTPEQIVQMQSEVARWATEAIAAILAYPDNPFADEEEAAAAVLKLAEERCATHPTSVPNADA
jgi:hypothetical protein